MTTWILEACGYASVLAGFYVYYSNTMIPLRIAAIISNALFIPYAFYRGLYPQLVLNAVLMPLNFYRLWQMKHLIAQVKEAAEGALDFEWLKAFMQHKDFAAGDVLFRQGDVGTELFFIVSGTVRLPEVGIVLGAGTLLGEMGLFTEGNRRTTSAIAAESLRTLRISYEEMLELYFQNPQFGLYLMRLITQRFVGAVPRRPEPAKPAAPADTDSA